MGNTSDTASLARLLPTQVPADGISAEIDRILRAVRAHLDMDVAFVSEFMDDVRIFRHVDAAGWTPVQTGDAIPLDAGYCKRVVEGILPRLIPDTAQVPAAVAIPETAAVPIGAHISVPVRLSDGRLYGTFCCFGFKAEPTLNERDLRIMETFGELVAFQVERQICLQHVQEEKRARVSAVLDQGGPQILFQPICRLSDGELVGVESLSRFPSGPDADPETWFSDANEAGMGLALETSAIRNALQALGQLPDSLYLAVNASPETLMDASFDALFQDVDPTRIVLELTEHVRVRDYAGLMQRIARLRARGMRLSVDDAGAGYASMRHILNLHPEMIKLDVSLTRGIDQDPARRALAAALIDFGRQTGCSVLAEGIETPAEYALLGKLGATNAQGFYLSPPLQLPELLRFAHDHRIASPAGRRSEA
ncbi:EAL domain-containing protein [Uliginosibacterium paludis]|uniref:EAL domain-containing protein n=1 Tax=Uliginosibacterium paludis TaxID=1615952 RepID=A0ABV2CQG8_9RHOO